MDFKIGTAEQIKITNLELSTLLTEVYVEDEFTTTDEANTLFEPSSVRNRGLLIGVRDNLNATLAGIIILVPSSSPACRLAKENEAEIHLLGVRRTHRQRGIGRMLVQEAINTAKRKHYSNLILWTQVSMKAAQRLYESLGFVFVKEINKNDRNFLVYERAL